MDDPDRGKKLEEKVESWLSEQGVDYIREAKVDLLNLRIDFLVLRPKPVAFEVRLRAPGLPFSNQHGKHMLTQRIAIGDEFGPHVPFVLILPVPESGEKPENSSIPFVDGVFTVDALPEWETLPEHIHFDKLTQNILRHSASPENAQIEERSIANRWSRSLPLEDLAFSESAFPKDTLAGWLQDSIHEKIDSARSEGDKAKTDEFGDAEKLLRRMRLDLDPIITDYVVEGLGGETVHERERIGGDSGLGVLISLDGWRAPDDTLFAIRSIRGSGNAIRTHKAREIVATGAILRTLYPITSGGLVLLFEGVRRSSREVLSGSTSERNVDTLAINRLSQSGWNVFPWDFAEPEPEFVRYLREQVDK